MPFSAFGNSPSRYVTEELKRIVTSPTNIRRLIFFDKNDSSTTLEDRSVNGQNATLSLAASSLDPSSAGKARVLNFNAAGDYWEFADADDLSFGNGTADSPFSIIACVNMNSVSLHRILSKYDVTTGNTKKEYTMTISTNILVTLYDESANTQIGRKNSTTLAGDVGSFHTYIGTYSGSGAASGIKIYRDGTRIDDTDNNVGTYVSMENTGSSVGNYYISSTGAVGQVGTYKSAVIAIVSEELTPAQVASIDLLLRRYVGVV